MLSTRIWTLTLAAWFAITFVLCIGWCAVAPEGWHARAFLEMALPGFVWLSPGSFAIGLLESVALGAYSGGLLAVLHNRLISMGATGQARAARAAL